MYLIFILIRTTVARHSCECRTTFVRMTLSFIFSPDSREFFACCLKTAARPSCDTRTTFVRVSRKFRIVNSPKFRGDRFATFARPSRDSLAKYFGKKVRIQFLNMFATSSRHVKILTTLARMSCESAATKLIRVTVARNSHASEILA